MNYIRIKRDNTEVLKELARITPQPRDDEQDNILYAEVQQAIKQKNKTPKRKENFKK